ncbi:MAG: class I SAM-dependent methyltransferase [Acidobacteriota bacterium]
MEKIRKEFDRIALLSEQRNDTGGVYDQFLLRFVPNACERALEIGCGTGSFTRLLAARVSLVTAIDLSPEMVRVARLRSANDANIDYQIGDILQCDLPDNRFDCIVMIATLHHFPIDPVLEKIKKALASGGVLVLHDLVTPSGIADRALDLLRLSVNAVVRWRRTGRPWVSRAEWRAWADHCKGETYQTMKEVRAMCDRYLPEAVVKEHLLWRYSVIWRKQTQPNVELGKLLFLSSLMLSVGFLC